MYKFGARQYTLLDIYQCGYFHGEAQIVYYPPQLWGGPSNALFQYKKIPLACGTYLEEIYRQGYREGFKYFYQIMGKI